MQSGRRTILTIAIAVCLGVALFFAIVHGGKKEMEPSQVTEGGLFAPQEFQGQRLQYKHIPVSGAAEQFRRHQRHE